MLGFPDADNVLGLIIGFTKLDAPVGLDVPAEEGCEKDDARARVGADSDLRVGDGFVEGRMLGEGVLIGLLTG
jgi:hypothetical protein